MKKIAFISVRLLIVFMIITGVAYPLAITLFGAIVFPNRSQGSFILKDGTAVGSMLVGQSFTSAKYFHARPSACGYDPIPSGATNFGQTSMALRDSVIARRKRFLFENKLSSNIIVPKEMLFASASGLDPDISPEAAMMQIRRIAEARGYDNAKESTLPPLVWSFTQEPELGFLGRPRVNVLLLNLTLDEMDR